MKIKTIRKILKSKIEDWADSVSDNPEIKKIILENTIVTGGCIASMLLGKDVNDFDVYLDSKDACKKITQYYVGKFQGKGIEVIDGKDYPNFDYNEVNGQEHSDDSFWMCSNGVKVNGHQHGRCVHKIDSDRIKLFMPNKGVFRVESDDLLYENGDKRRYYPCHFSSNAITLTDDIQIVIRFHGDAEKIHENYDFVHATNWYRHEDNHLEIRKEALESLITQELRYIGSKYPLTSVIRTKKFIQRGFSIGAGTYLKILYQVSQLDLNDLTVLEDQLAGVDVAYFEILLDALKDANKQDNFTLTYPYLCELIDRIFDE